MDSKKMPHQRVRTAGTAEWDAQEVHGDYTPEECERADFLFMLKFGSVLLPLFTLALNGHQIEVAVRGVLGL